jgi:hypothetical protein
VRNDRRTAAIFSARRTVAALLVGGLVACGGGTKERERGGLEPTFEPTEDARAPTTTASGATSAPTTIVLGGTDAVPEPGATTTTAAAPTTEASISDAAGDATPSPVDPAPAWSDLLGARLTRSQSGFELRVRLAGGDAPEGSGSADHTMNIASFYDVDGDGEIDFDVWANIADGGWSGSYFNNRDGTGGYDDASQVAIRTEGDEILISFPRSHLADATRFRWSVASEWGRYEAIGTPAMVRDVVPDDGEPAPFDGR